MPGIGKLEYPEVSYTNALETIDRIRTKSIKTIHGLAEELGYSTRSKSPGGTFYYKLVALDKMYGLIIRDRGNLALSPLGQRIAFPLNAGDRAEAIRQSILRVEILRSLHEALGESYHESDFRPKLRELTGAQPDEIDREAGRIEGVYQDALQYLGAEPIPAGSTEESGTMAGPPGGGQPGRRGAPAPAPQQPASSGVPTFDRPVRNLHSEDGYFIRVVLEVGVIEEAIAVLTALRNRVAHLPSATGSTADGSPLPDSVP